MTYLYQHIRNDSNEVFYIGIGSRYRAFDKGNRNKHWRGVTEKHGYTVELIKSFEDWYEAAEWEKLFILLYGRQDNGTGQLVNLTDGGEGSYGRSGELHPFYGKKRPDHSSKMKGRKSQSTSLRMSGENHFFYGVKRPKEHGENISKSKKGKCTGENNPFYGKSHTEEVKEKIAEKQRKVIVDAETNIVAFNSLKEAAEKLGIKETTLSAQLRGRNKNKTKYKYLNN